jgi:hypothetical protein
MATFKTKREPPPTIRSRSSRVKPQTLDWSSFGSSAIQHLHQHTLNKSELTQSACTDIRSHLRIMTTHISLHDAAPEHRHLLSTLSTHISRSKRSIIITGAGISCNAGIPVPTPHIFHTIDHSRIFVHKMDYTTSSRQGILKQ